MEQQPMAWKGRTHGTPWMQRALIASLRWTPLTIVYGGMAIVILFYMLFYHQGYISQYHYFRRRFLHNPLRSFFDVYFNHFRFGQIILDRFAFYGGRRFKLVIEGNEQFMAKTYEPTGMMQVGAHVGNFELAGYMLSQDRKPINALVFGGETGTVMENRTRIFQHQNLRLILTGDGMDHIFELNRALADGEIVSMHGDRVFGSQKTFTVSMLGAPALFPAGPFLLAATREVPMFCTFVMKETVNTYHIYVHQLTVDPTQTTTVRTRAQALAQDFADRLTAILKKYPYQWFNYYDFWLNE